MDVAQIFLDPQNSTHRQYEALRAYFVDQTPGPTGFTGLLRQIAAQDIKVHSNKKILLADGTPAYRTHLTWRLRALDLTS